MALPRDVFKQKMQEGRELAKEKREEQLKSQQQILMERAVEERAREIEAQEKEYGGYSDLSQPEVSEESDQSNRGNGRTHDDRVHDLRRDQRDTQSSVSPKDNAGDQSRENAVSCRLCRGFPWTNVPLEIARERFRWLSKESARVADIITHREAESSRKRGCSICGGHPTIPDHWFATKHTIDRATGAEYTLYACSQPCYIQWAAKYPQFFGVTRGGGWNPNA